MKRQYLGDAKDSFTWDYLDTLTEQMNFNLLNIALMLTPDDGSNEGNLHPTRFPAREEIIHFCHELRAKRSLTHLCRLPNATGARYRVELHQSDTHFEHHRRKSYFDNIDKSKEQIFFADPDNGFEPEKSCSQKHIRYSDVENIMEQLGPSSVLTLFQHHRRKPFPIDYQRIRQRLGSKNCTAVHWHSVMFVSVSHSAESIDRVTHINHCYAKDYPVKVIA